ncbi:RHS repeat-associated core domain-containing protein [uncultured Paludibaculum sp.]|uniref:RHS repeat-associated core domain-containing protein n=1 Tax=uncultured Paludibaculum sp. TaxID=1765020 RepID=UPI002AAB5AF6|nr:RHS repeat-associated core domain-containing protein [uncultured Paludibaculum sp.]
MFTGKERDGETGLDYFGARYFSGAQGRFTTPDWSAKPAPIPFADLSDPQSLNLYAYVRNSPLKNRDPDGHICIFGMGNTCTTVSPPKPVRIPPPSIDTRTMLTLSGVSVRYNNHTVSDKRVRTALDGIMMSFGKSVNVVSGDRNVVPKGGATKSAHLTGQAADFHIISVADNTAFQKLQENSSPVSEGLRLIKHGPFTQTEAAHLHLDSRNDPDSATSFMTEGTEETNRGVYTTVAKPKEEEK